ncbi:MAG: sigma-E factor negative regulatory protein [Pseudomonadota bacterium]
MTEQLKEALSAAIDGEADEFELRRVLDEVGRDPELAAAWGRYHRIGESLRGESAALTAPELAAMGDAVWASLADEIAQADTPALALMPDTEPVAVPAATASGAWKRVAPFAVAASVAAAVLLGLGGNQNSGPTQQVADSQIEIEGPILPVESEVSPSDVQRANAYMLHHVQQKALNNPGVASFVKVVTFEKPQEQE